MHIMPLHPSLDLLWVHFLASDVERQILFLYLYEVSLLAFLDYPLHLSWFDVLVKFPLAQTQSILTNPSTLLKSDSEVELR